MSEPTVVVQAQFSASLSPDERREAVRYFSKCPHPIDLLVRPKMEPLRAVVKNVSAAGLGLLADRRIRPGTVLALTLRSDCRPLIQIAQVMHATPCPDGAWLIGCKLSAPLMDQDLQALAR